MLPQRFYDYANIGKEGIRKTRLSEELSLRAMMEGVPMFTRDMEAHAISEIAKLLLKNKTCNMIIIDTISEIK